MSAANLLPPLPSLLRRHYPVRETAIRGWTAADLLQQPGWELELDAETLADLTETAWYLQHHPVAGLHRGLVQSAAVDQLAARIRHELFQGTGVVWLRGAGGVEEPILRRVFGLLANHLGSPIDTYGRQYDVRDTGQNHLLKAIPVSQTAAETTFHTDSSSILQNPAIVSLLCIRPALSGGRSLVSHAGTAHELLRQTTPELLRLLYRDFVRDVVTPGLSPDSVFINRFPIFRNGHNGLCFRYMRYWIERGHTRVNCPLSADERAALNALDAHLNAPANVVGFDMAAGDMLFVNNYTVAHNRTAFVDDPTAPRLLVRMWLARLD